MAAESRSPEPRSAHAHTARAGRRAEELFLDWRSGAPGSPAGPAGRPGQAVADTIAPAMGSGRGPGSNTEGEPAAEEHV